MSARIGRTRAAVAVAVFAMIAATWATVQAGQSTAAPVDIIPHCISSPPTGDPVQDCTVEYSQGNVNPNDTGGLAKGAATGEVEEDQNQANAQLSAAQSGNGPVAGVPGVAGAPVADGVGLWEDSGGDPFTESRMCAALATDAGDVNAAADGARTLGNAIVKDPVGWARENIVKQPATLLPPPDGGGGTRSGTGAQGDPCHDNNKYHCWDVPLYMKRDYTPAIYWHWGTYIKWCGYSLGAITQRDYDDHNVLGTGFNCEVKSMQRTPLEKINRSHWQQHTNTVFTCKIGGAFKDDHPTEGAHYYSNGYHEDIEKGGN